MLYLSAQIISVILSPMASPSVTSIKPHSGLLVVVWSQPHNNIKRFTTTKRDYNKEIHSNIKRYLIQKASGAKPHKPCATLLSLYQIINFVFEVKSMPLQNSKRIIGCLMLIVISIDFCRGLKPSFDYLLMNFLPLQITKPLAFLFTHWPTIL